MHRIYFFTFLSKKVRKKKEEMGDSLLLEQHIVDPSSAPQSRFPVANFQISEIIDGVKTEFVTTEFEDKLFFVITQISKLGTLV